MKKPIYKKPFAPFKSFFFVYLLFGTWVLFCIALGNAIAGPENWVAHNEPRNLWKIALFCLVLFILSVILVWYYGFR